MSSTACSPSSRLNSESGPLRPDDQPGPRRHLPRPLTSFVGREGEIAAIVTRLRREDVHLVTLTGAGGVGKTRLAIRVAKAVAADFPDGLWFVPLAPVRDPDLIASTVAQFLGVPETGERSITEVLTGLLAQRQALLILDNFEHVLEAAPLITDLLAACPAVKVLVTSRAVLRLSGEHDITIPPLASVNPEQLPSLALLREAEAVRLFVDRATAANNDFVQTDATIVDVAILCARLDGLPLAIELAAARTRVLSPRVMLQRLDQRLRLLTGGARDQPARLRSLQGAIAWSYDLLTPDEQALFRRLAVFAGGFSLEAAEAVCRAGASETIDVLDGVASLVDNSLLGREDGAEAIGARFAMLETVHEFALDQLHATGEQAVIQRAHAEPFLALAEQGERELIGPDERIWMERLVLEHANLRAALAWATAQSAPEIGLRLAGALGDFWTGLGTRAAAATYAVRHGLV
jgi:predicted ATPase